MADNNRKNTTPRRDPSPLGRPKYWAFWIYGVPLAIIIGWWIAGSSEEPVKTSWNKVEQMISQGDVEKIDIINKEAAEVYLKDERIKSYKDQSEYKNIPDHGVQFTFNIGSVDTFRSDLDKIEEASGENIPIAYDNRRSVWIDVLAFLPYLLIILFFYLMMRSASKNAAGGGANGVFNVGKAKAQMFDKDGTNKITFKDVAGLEEAKVEIMEIVDFLRKPQKYRELGGKIPKGALLVGPPGTGKTLLAKAVAGEANVPFFSISGSDFVEMFVGVGASRVRDLFRQAKEKAPCIVFIDEIDAIGRARGKNTGFSGNDERENTLNQLLTEMDGFGTNAGVIILAATNRADILDKALMRAGRFDRQIEVGLPNLKEREEIFDVHLKILKLDKNLDRAFLARQTVGFSGADIANVCNEAALIAARHNKAMVEREDFLSAIDRIVGGLERKSTVMTPQEKRATAFHEAGHATVSWFLEDSSAVVKITIIPRGRSLGATWYLPEERVTKTRDQFIREMASLLAGRVSEKLFFGTMGTGAVNDLERATKIAYAMVVYYGMSDKIGNICYYDSTGQNDMSFTKPYSEQTAEDIDKEVRNLVDQAYALAEKTLTDNRAGLERLANMLLEREVVFSEDVESIFGMRPVDQAKAQQQIAETETMAEQQTPTGDSSKQPVDNSDPNDNPKA